MEESVVLKKSIGILYICTGPYKVFWKDFYNSFQKYFLPEYEKHYYVFTDGDKLEEEGNTEYIHYYKIENLPWPLITLLRFRFFLKAEEELKNYQFLMFVNANMVCDDYVYSKEFLPDIKRGEKLFFTKHPGYCKEKPWNTPLDRNKKSSAYIPYNRGNIYVIGALFGGYTESFLEMTRTLDERICEDLKRGIIAKWHDESHINHYILKKNNCRLLSAGYCYPVGFMIDEKKKISAVPKADKFNVNEFKGYYNISSRNEYWLSILKRILNKMHPVKMKICVFRDFLLRREIAQ